MKLVFLLIIFAWLPSYDEVNINLSDQYEDIANRLVLKKTQCDSSCPFVEYVTNQRILSIEEVPVSGYLSGNTVFLFKKPNYLCQIMLKRSLPTFDRNVKEIEKNFEELNQKLIKKYGKPITVDRDFYPSRTMTWDRNKNNDYIILTFLENDIHGNNTVYLTFFGNNYQKNCFE